MSFLFSLLKVQTSSPTPHSHLLHMNDTLLLCLGQRRRTHAHKLRQTHKQPITCLAGDIYESVCAKDMYNRIRPKESRRGEKQMWQNLTAAPGKPCSTYETTLVGGYLSTSHCMYYQAHSGIGTALSRNPRPNRGMFCRAADKSESFSAVGR